MKKLLIERDEASVGYYMERLRPQVTNICSRINSLDTSTARNRLCQAEIAKKVAHLMRAVVSLQQGENNSSSSGMLTKTLLTKTKHFKILHARASALPARYQVVIKTCYVHIKRFKSPLLMMVTNGTF